MIGKIILGLLIIIAAVVIANPEYADEAWDFAMGLLGLIGNICIIGSIIIGIIVIVVLILVFRS